MRRADGHGNSDPRLYWTAPTNGSYVIAIGDLFHKGGDDFIYRLVIAPPKPDFKVTITEHAIRLEPGKTNEIKIDITRINKHTNTLAITVEAVPDGITAKPAEVPAK